LPFKKVGPHSLHIGGFIISLILDFLFQLLMLLQENFFALSEVLANVVYKFLDAISDYFLVFCDVFLDLLVVWLVNLALFLLN